ncbi:PapB/FocB family fimbrial expression transcriptional regulator [Pseudomonas sp. DSV-1]|uniref:PapB/FocB family fimbrial expression transcriptional regulator n=1 Tax=Pseudomonas sp. DSV-1 TaxID=3112250 RepID=UPI002DC02C12|nr:PapB/FocB family fimbrial expression transcriptional regulator [Pseudomonas sp. DSV-1]MEC4242084.1 PapB/FocB family fimbrial expression transcriptional regulator [Pseudomonas sp. DSV-1]
MTSEIPGLVPGRVDKEHFDLLVRFARIRSESMITALQSHFVEGMPQRDVIDHYQVNQSQLSRKVGEIREVSEQVRAAAKYYS